MPAYNFQPRFVELIRYGDKHHTVRPRRKNPTKPGDRLFLYTGMRTKNCEHILSTVCTSVVPIKVYPDIREVHLDGRRLSLDDMTRFAKRDGFKNVYDFLDFFKRYSDHVRENDLEVIYWR